MVGCFNSDAGFAGDETAPAAGLDGLVVQYRGVHGFCLSPRT